MDNGFYIGFPTDLKRKLSEHKKGASFATSYCGPWRLIYYEGRVSMQHDDDTPVRRFPRQIPMVLLFESFIACVADSVERIISIISLSL